MDELDRKDVTVRNDPANSASNLSKARQVGVDTRSREAFELLKLGEAICNIQADQRRMRLSAEDMRFERDRYKASVATMQDKLIAALNENARLRDLREVLGALASNSEKTAQGARDDGEKIAGLTAALQERDAQLQQARDENERIAAELQYRQAAYERIRLATIELVRNIIEEARSSVEP